MPKIYIDGQSGTTGLQIRDRLKSRTDIELIEIDPDKRHDPAARKAMMEQADLTFLCLPDAAAIEAVKLAEGTGTKLIDASTAHRTTWTYGFPELDKDQTEKIRQARYVANPGCHATGAIAILAPLVKSGLIPKEEAVHLVSLTGYTGGGKAMIADYETAKTDRMASPRPYSLDKLHKHIPEIMKWTGLETMPAFVPVVDDFDRGMLVICTLPGLHGKETITSLYKDWYKDTDIHLTEDTDSLYTNGLKGSDSLELAVAENEAGITILARLDNLGKGACGAAIKNMELMLGL